MINAESFEGILPAGAILSDPAEIARRYRRNVSALQREVPLVLRPTTEEQVQAIVTRANERRIPLYPISTGRNWGLGSKLPVVDGCVVLDLGGMSRIVSVDDTFGYAIIEPGVTQLQLASRLREQHPGLVMNITGSFAHTSILGNVLERGDGLRARVHDLLGVRGVLGSGQPFEVGGTWSHVGSARPSHHLHHTAGPDLIGMFTQSSFAVVTQIAFRLIPRPERYHVCWGVVNDEQIEPVVDALALGARRGLVNAESAGLGYANRFEQARRSLVGEKTPPAMWNFYAVVLGTRRVAAAAVEELMELMGPLSVTQGVYCRETDGDPRAALPSFLHALIPQFQDMPDTSTIQLIYELTKTPMPDEMAELDVDQTPFGMLCYVPIVPGRGCDVRKAAEIVAAVGRQFELNTKLTLWIDGRCLITIHFRTDDEAQVRRATDCEATLWDRMVAAGYPPYRASINQMDRLLSLKPEFFELVGALKAQLDPNDIISPGRYAARRASRQT